MKGLKRVVGLKPICFWFVSFPPAKACVDLARREDALDDLPPEVLAGLQEAVRMSYDESNLIQHETVQKERAK